MLSIAPTHDVFGDDMIIFDMLLGPFVIPASTTLILLSDSIYTFISITVLYLCVPCCFSAFAHIAISFVRRMHGRYSRDGIIRKPKVRGHTSLPHTNTAL